MNMSKKIKLPLLMGVVNVTPDSFSDGGKYTQTRTAVTHALKLISQGASIIDIGGESSRPGAKPVPALKELQRVVPVIKSLVKRRNAESQISRQSPWQISIDTYKPEVAAIALELGVDIVNDISGLRDPLMRKIIAKTHCEVVLMHMLGEPGTMQKNPRYNDVVTDIIYYFKRQIQTAKKDGIAPTQIILDPGIGFGKTVAHNIEILRNIKKIKQAFPKHHLLIGASRKSFIGKLTNVAGANDRLPGTLAAHLFAAHQGADILRVHDVIEHAQALTMFRTLFQK